MKESEILYAAAESMRKDGYSPLYRHGQGCGCFADHIHRAARVVGTSKKARNAAWARTLDLVGSFLVFDLKDAGWNKRDAIAALTIAADCAFEEEKAQ